MYPPAVLESGVEESLTSSQIYRLPPLMLWGCIRRAPSTGGSYHTGAFLPQRSRPVPRPVVLDVLALLVDRAEDIPALWQVIFGVPVWFASKLEAFCSGRAVLVLVRPVVSYTLALILTTLSAGGVSSSALYNAPCRPLATPKLPTAGLFFVLRKLRSPQT